MNKSVDTNAYVVMAQGILQKMSLEPTAMTVSEIAAIAHKAKGSLRDFANDLIVDAIKLGGVVPQ